MGAIRLLRPPPTIAPITTRRDNNNSGDYSRVIPLPFLASSTGNPTLRVRSRNHRFPVLAGGSSFNGNGPEGAEDGEGKDSRKEEDSDDLKSSSREPRGQRGRPELGIRWRDLILDPDPENILAVALTGLLTWASVQVLWQLFFISVAILLAALKYSFIAALLLLILISLL